MLPPLDESILQANPNFAALYTTLETNILNPNGSTVKHALQKERAAASDLYKATRIRAAKTHHLRASFADLDLVPTRPPTKTTSKFQQDLPIEIIEIITLLSARFAAPDLPKPSVKLLESTTQWTSIVDHLPDIGGVISAYLQSLAIALARIQSPITNPSFLHRTIPKLVDNVESTRSSVISKESALARRRTALVGKTTTLLSRCCEAITLVIKVLEQTKHGSLSRYVKTRAEYLSATAMQANLEAREKSIRGKKMVYTAEVVTALQNYLENLKDGQERLRERERGAKRELWGYGIGRQDDNNKEKLMKEVARMYEKLVKECYEVGEDVKKLRR